jgi:hypothetical protein
LFLPEQRRESAVDAIAEERGQASQGNGLVLVEGADEKGHDQGLGWDNGLVLVEGADE